MKKSILSLALVLAVLASMTVFAVREEPATTEPAMTTINEYEMLQQLAAKPAEQLTEEGFSDSEIIEIQNYKENYSEHISALQELDDAVLEAHGYSSEQIDVIRNFSGTEEEMLRASATVNLYSTTSMFRTESDGSGGVYSKGRLVFGWDWHGIPDFKWTDIVAFSWNTWKLEGSSCSVGYFDVLSGFAYKTQDATLYKASSLGLDGAGFKFPMALDNNKYYAKNGSGYFDLKSDVHSLKDFYCYGEYGHNQVFINSPTFSVGTGGADLSITFSAGTVCADSTSVQYEW